MRVLVIPDKFKGSLSAARAAQAIAEGLRRVHAKWQVTLFPLSDGGEGFVQALTQARGGRVHAARTTGPRGESCRARYGILPDGTAVLDVTEASGFWRVPVSARHPGQLSTEGTGVLIDRLARHGAPRLLIGLGGSSTNDGGIGLAAPCGFSFLDARGRSIPLNGDGLARLHRIVPPNELWPMEIIVATDVENPLYGPNGAAHQFAGQKGATPAEIAQLDDNLRRLAAVAQECLGHSAHEEPGAGAAGGCGYGLMTFLRARRVSGFEVFREWTALDEAIRTHDLVITGEGCLDHTSTHGKGPWAVAQLARAAGKTVWAVCGVCRLQGGKSPFDAVAELVRFAPTEGSARKRAAHFATVAAESLARA